MCRVGDGLRGLAEGMQYFLGFLGPICDEEEIWRREKGEEGRGRGGEHGR